jgi:hypothetical protein
MRIFCQHISVTVRSYKIHDEQIVKEMVKIRTIHVPETCTGFGVEIPDDTP